MIPRQFNWLRQKHTARVTKSSFKLNAAKYVVDTIDDKDYTSAAALFGVELRHTFHRPLPGQRVSFGFIRFRLEPGLYSVQ